jgi:hypothetical protein
MANYQKETEEKVMEDIRDFITNEKFSDFDNQPRIILVANDYREETLASVLWLRTHRVDITCVKLEPYKIGDKIAIKPAIIIPLPEAEDYMVQVEEKKLNLNKFTPRQMEYKKFWNKIIKEYVNIDPNFRVKNPYPQSWLWYGASKAGLNYSWTFSEGQFTIELYMSGDQKRSDRYFNQLIKSRNEMKKKSVL